jgi:hypothetical protein
MRDNKWLLIINYYDYYYALDYYFMNKSSVDKDNNNTFHYVGHSSKSRLRNYAILSFGRTRCSLVLAK